MTYQNYVIAAYAVFGIVLLWDLLAPRFLLRAQLRAARLRSTRETSRPAQPELIR